MVISSACNLSCVFVDVAVVQLTVHINCRQFWTFAPNAEDSRIDVLTNWMIRLRNSRIKIARKWQASEKQFDGTHIYINCWPSFADLALKVLSRVFCESYLEIGCNLDNYVGIGLLGYVITNSVRFWLCLYGSVSLFVLFFGKWLSNFQCLCSC